MSLPPNQFRVSRLDTKLDRSRFDSGDSSLNDYFRGKVTQDVRRMVTACFVALNDAQEIAGFYTLASASVPLVDLPEEFGKRLPRYPSVPAVRMGRLAVDQTFRGQGLGGALLADALDRTISSEIAAYAMIVDAKNEIAADFYQHHGFITLPSSPLALFLPLAGVRNL